MNLTCLYFVLYTVIFTNLYFSKLDCLPDRVVYKSPKNNEPSYIIQYIHFFHFKWQL